MLKDFDDKEPEKGRSRVGHDSDALAEFGDCFLDGLWVGFVVGGFEQSGPKFHHLGKFGLGDEFGVVVFLIFKLFLGQIFGNQLDSSLWVIQLLNVLVERVVDLGESLLAGFRFGFECLYHLC